MFARKCKGCIVPKQKIIRDAGYSLAAVCGFCLSKCVFILNI